MAVAITDPIELPDAILFGGRELPTRGDQWTPPPITSSEWMLFELAAVEWRFRAGALADLQRTVAAAPLRSQQRLELTAAVAAEHERTLNNTLKRIGELEDLHAVLQACWAAEAAAAVAAAEAEARAAAAVEEVRAAVRAKAAAAAVTAAASAVAAARQVCTVAAGQVYTGMDTAAAGQVYTAAAGQVYTVESNGQHQEAFDKALQQYDRAQTEEALEGMLPLTFPLVCPNL